jgi:hypothetical protein
LIFIFLLGVTARILIQPHIFFSLGKMMSYFFIVLKYTVLFNVLGFLLDLHGKKDKNKDAIKRNISFAPFMFLGAITIESSLIKFVMNFLIFLKQ